MYWSLFLLMQSWVKKIASAGCTVYPFALIQVVASVFTTDFLAGCRIVLRAGLRYAVRIQPRQATAHAKLLNATSNIGGLLLFILGGKVIWATGFVMSVGQFLGARMGQTGVEQRTRS
ncbi:TSUP family transporter [Shigella sonnei]